MEIRSESINIYDYVDPIEYIKAIYDQKKVQNPNYSLRAWSTKMQFKSSATIFQLINKQKRLRADLLANIYKGISLSPNERLYFETLIDYINEQSEKEKQFHWQEIEKLRRFSVVKSIPLQATEIISAWYSLTIIEMTNLHDFKNDPAWIAERLGNKTSVQEVDQMIDALIAHGLLKEENGKLIKTNQRLIAGDDGKVSEAIRNNHREILKQASRAIDEQSIDKRYISSTTMTIDSAKIPEANKLIAEFRTNLVKLLEKKSGDSTYQLNVQLFSMTE